MDGSILVPPVSVTRFSSLATAIDLLLETVIALVLWEQQFSLRNVRDDEINLSVWSVEARCLLSVVCALRAISTAQLQVAGAIGNARGLVLVVPVGSGPVAVRGDERAKGSKSEQIVELHLEVFLDDESRENANFADGGKVIYLYWRLALKEALVSMTQSDTCNVPSASQQCLSST